MSQKLSDFDGSGELVPDSFLFGLPNWYSRIRTVPISDWEVFDLCRAFRQDIFPELLVPYAMEWLRIEPDAGEVDGELAEHLIEIGDDYWAGNPKSAEYLQFIRDRCSIWLKPETLDRVNRLLRIVST